MIHQYAREHRLGDGGRTNTHAGVMAAGRFHEARRAVRVDRAARQADARSRLEREGDGDVLPGRDAAQHAAVVVGEEALRRHLVAVLASLLPDGVETGAYFHTLYGVDR